MDILTLIVTVCAVEFHKVLIFISLIVLIPSLHASPKQQKTRRHTAATKATKPGSDATPITLKDGRLGRIENGRVMLAQADGKYAVAPTGRYTMRDGKVLLVGNEGRLTNSASLKADVAPQPETKRTAPASNGQHHQTGSNL